MKPACKDTHGLLLHGICPWCEQPVVDGQLKPELPAREAAIRQWNIPAMLRSLAHEDTDARSMVVSNLMLHGTRTEESLTVLRKALSNSEKDVRWLTVQALQNCGRNLCFEEAERFEQESQHHAEDCALHFLLLGYYFLPASRSDAARRARQKHVLWVIRHAAVTVAESHSLVDLDLPTDGEAYEQAKQLWIKHVQANEGNVTILGGAARFFTLHDKELSEALFKKAQELEPGNPEWSEYLGHLYSLGMIKVPSDARREAAIRSWSEYERAFACEQEELKRLWMLPNLAKVALEAGQFDKARAYATDLLSSAGRPKDAYLTDGPAIHYGNLVLGLLALREGDREKAKRHLILQR